TRSKRDWSSDVCSSDLRLLPPTPPRRLLLRGSGQSGKRLCPSPPPSLLRPGRTGDENLSGTLDPKRLSLLNRRKGVGNHLPLSRSEERRVGTECTYRST